MTGLRGCGTVAGMSHAPIVEALTLRFTEREVSLVPPDIAAFSGAPRAEHEEGSPLAELVAAGVLAARVQVFFEAGDGPAPVFVTARGAPIPDIDAGEEGDEIEVAPAGAFVLATQLDGHFVWAPSRLSQRALALAVCLPLGLPDVASAQAPVAPPAATVAPAPAPTPVAVTPPAPVVAPPAPVVAPARATVEAILKSMNGREGVVTARKATVAGLIIGVEGDLVTIVDYTNDGKIVMLPKSDILEIRGRVPPPPMPPSSQRGVGMIVGGALLTGVGAPLMLSGIVFSTLDISYALYLGLPQIIPAAALLSAGIPLLVFGTRRRKAYDAQLKQQTAAGRLMPTVGRTRHGGWTGGLVLRF